MTEQAFTKKLLYNVLGIVIGALIVGIGSQLLMNYNSVNQMKSNEVINSQKLNDHEVRLRQIEALEIKTKLEIISDDLKEIKREIKRK